MGNRGLWEGRRWPKSQVAYVAWRNLGLWGVGGKSQIAAVKPKSQVACVAWEIWAFGGVGGKSEESDGLCSMGNRGVWEGRGKSRICSMESRNLRRSRLNPKSQVAYVACGRAGVKPRSLGGWS